MSIPAHKRDSFVETFGEEVVAEFDEQLDMLGKAADAARLPKKEYEMTDEKDLEQVAEEQPVGEVAAEVTEEIAEVEAAVEEAPEETPEDVGMTPTEFTLPKEVIAEIVTGVAEPFNQVMSELQAVKAELETVQKELESVKDVRETQAAQTPIASLGSQISQSIIGKQAAQVNYNKERDLYQGPEEAKEAEGSGRIGIPAIDNAISRQRGGIVRGS